MFYILLEYNKKSINNNHNKLMFVKMLNFINTIYNYILSKRLLCRHNVEMSKTDKNCLNYDMICLWKSKKIVK